MQPAVTGLVDEDASCGNAHSGESDGVEIAVGRERKPGIASGDELTAGAERERDRNLLPGSAAVQRDTGDDILDRPQDPRSHHVIRIHRVYGYGRFRGVVEGE